MGKYVEVVFILDESGSMHHLKDDTIGGFNSMIEKQKDSEGDALVTAVCFSSDHRTIIDREDIKNVKKLTDEDYQPNSNTALLDAMGDTIHHIEQIHKYIRTEDLPEKTIFMITTDGMENSSHKYSSDEIKKLVEAKTEEGWEFIFMAANIDAVETAAQYGMRRDRAIRYRACKEGTERMYDANARFVTRMMACESIDDAFVDLNSEIDMVDGN